MIYRNFINFLTRISKSIIPDKYFPLIVDIKNNCFRKFKKSYYSQFGEDGVLAKLFDEKDGFYVDVGAYHPKLFSNTYLLFKKGWKGINIDPNPYTIKLFKKYRKHDTNLQVGISEVSGLSTFYTFSHSNWNTFSKEKVEEWKKKPDVRYLGEQQIQRLPLREVLAKYLPSGKEIDLLNIDAEGLDMEVLQSNDWTKYQPRVIVIECTNFDLSHPLESAVYSFLLAKNYRLYAFFGLSLIFVKNGK